MVERRGAEGKVEYSTSVFSFLSEYENNPWWVSPFDIDRRHRLLKRGHPLRDIQVATNPLRRLSKEQLSRLHSRLEGTGGRDEKGMKNTCSELHKGKLPLVVNVHIDDARACSNMNVSYNHLQANVNREQLAKGHVLSHL